MNRPTGPIAAVLPLAAVAGCAANQAAACVDAAQETPFAAEVVSFSPGPGAGFGADALPCVVLGPPAGGGAGAGGMDVLSLGDGGTLTLRLGLPALDGPGPDLLVFENPFSFAGGAMVFAEPLAVAVSEDGATFSQFSCDPDGGEGCAGITPVLAGPNAPDVDPTDPAAAGGDGFDLAELGLPGARFVRLTDAGVSGGAGGARGADVDAVAVVHPEPSYPGAP